MTRLDLKDLKMTQIEELERLLMADLQWSNSSKYYKPCIIYEAVEDYSLCIIISHESVKVKLNIHP